MTDFNALLVRLSWVITKSKNTTVSWVFSSKCLFSFEPHIFLEYHGFKPRNILRIFIWGTNLTCLTLKSFHILFVCTSSFLLSRRKIRKITKKERLILHFLWIFWKRTILNCGNHDPSLVAIQFFKKWVWTSTLFSARKIEKDWWKTLFVLSSP